MTRNYTNDTYRTGNIGNIVNINTDNYYIPTNETKTKDYLEMELKQLKTVISNTKNLFKIFNRKYPKLNINLELTL